jgi:hypothetical protein
VPRRRIGRSARWAAATLLAACSWTRLTRDYLRIRPHPELSWWAMRGQLVDSPGYMMNYAAGAILIVTPAALLADMGRMKS